MCCSVQFSSAAQSCPTFCDPMDCNMPGFPVHHQLPGACLNSCPLSRWCHPTISYSVIQFSSRLQSFAALSVFSSKSVLCIRWPKYWSFSFGISPFNEYSGLISLRIDWFDLLAVHLHQFKSINSSMLSFLYSPALTSIHDYWKHHSFDYTDICWQSSVSAFEYAI